MKSAFLQNEHYKAIRRDIPYQTQHDGALNGESLLVKAWCSFIRKASLRSRVGETATICSTMGLDKGKSSDALNNKRGFLISRFSGGGGKSDIT